MCPGCPLVRMLVFVRVPAVCWVGWGYVCSPQCCPMLRSRSTLQHLIPTNHICQTPCTEANCARGTSNPSVRYLITVPTRLQRPMKAVQCRRRSNSKLQLTKRLVKKEEGECPPAKESSVNYGKQLKGTVVPQKATRSMR